MKRKGISLFVFAVAMCLAAAQPALAQPAVQTIVDDVSQTYFRAYLGYPGDLTDPTNPLLGAEDLRNPLNTHAGDDRNNGQPDWVEAQDNMVTILSGFGLTAEKKYYSGYGTYQIEATLTGTTRPDDIYIIGAHYDSVTGYPGADDNASGTAGVLEAARVLSQYEFEATIKFIAFDREEDGLFGSKDYAAAAAGRGDNILGMVNLDMIAFNKGTTTVDIEYFSLTETSGMLADMEAAIDTYGDGLGRIKSSAGANSDHHPFYANGYPSLLLIEDWGNPYYHQATDNVDNTHNGGAYLDYDMGTRIVQSAVGYLATEAVPTPEPATMSLLALGAMSILIRRGRRLAASSR